MQTTFSTVAIASDPAQHAAITVVVVDPFKTAALKIDLVQRWCASVKPVQVTNQVPDTAVRRVIQQVPVERLIVIPFVTLRDLVAP